MVGKRLPTHRLLWKEKFSRTDKLQWIALVIKQFQEKILSEKRREKSTKGEIWRRNISIKHTGWASSHLSALPADVNPQWIIPVANAYSRDRARVECRSDRAVTLTLSATADTLVITTVSLCETFYFHTSRNINSDNFTSLCGSTKNRSRIWNTVVP